MEPVTVFTTSSDIEASVIVALLDSHGIDSFRISGNPQAIWPMAVNALGPVRIAVAEHYAAEARRIIESHREDVGNRVVRLRDLHIEFIPEGHILVLAYEDRPGMVGRIGSILGRHNVNIASMHVGRRTRRGRAIVVLLLDDDVPGEVLDDVTKSVEADFARMIRL